MLPITRVVLYKHGVGYFERRGPVTGTTAVDLHFRASEMNDVLKSLTTIDLGEGIVSSISYESVTPIDQQLEDVALTLDDENVVSRLFAQVKGARVTVDVAGQKHLGIVLGIETITRVEDDREVRSPHLALLRSGQDVQTFDLQAVRSVTIEEESMRKDLQHLLDILVSSKKKDLKRLTIFATAPEADANATRELSASYIIANPVWKTSYRLLLPETASEKPLLQGWAIVDNTQDEDWEKVNLTLVAGLPISFVHDLYAPRYKRRPIVNVAEEEAYAPPVLETAAYAPMEADSQFAGAYAPQAMAAPVMRGAPPPAPSAKSRARLAASAPVQTRVVEVGDLFQYEIKNPVTVKRGQSALVPIVLAHVEGRRVAVFNPEIRAKNPMSAVLLKNTSGATLEGGPLTVLEEGSYVGEAMIETVKPDEQRIVPYSVELGCVVTLDPSSEVQPVSFSRIVNGCLYLTRYRLERSVYVINHKGAKSIDLFLDHRFKPGWEFVEAESTGKPVERTENFHRFQIALTPAAVTRFTVVERGDQTETRALTNFSKDEVQLWLTSKFIDEQTKQILNSLVDLQWEIAELARKVLQRETTVGEIFHNQERVRQNLGALGVSQDERGLRERYIADLASDEDRLRELREEIRRDKTLRESLEHDYRERLMTMTFQSSV